MLDSMANFVDEDDTLMLNQINHSNSSIGNDRIFSESMIALHDENGSNNDLTSLMNSKKDELLKQVKCYASNNNNNNNNNINHNLNSNSHYSENGEDNDDDDDDDADWSNDFGWSTTNQNFVVDTKSDLNINNTTLLTVDSSILHREKETSASLFSLQGSVLGGENQKSPSQSQNSVNISNRMTINNQQGAIDQNFAQYDIKNLNIVVKKPSQRDPSDDLIDSYLNDLTPKLNTNKAQEKINDNLIEMSELISNDRLALKLDSQAYYENGEKNRWECDELSDVDA
jgi:hypothetical protein